MSIDDTTFRRLLDLSDPVGVLTITVGFAPGRPGEAQPAARIGLRNQLREIQQQLTDEGRDDALRALEKRVDELGDDLDGLLDPRAPGRGRALFVALSDGRREHVTVQVPFEERVVVRERPFLRPLVAAIDEGRPAGIVVPDRQHVSILEWSLGATRELAVLDFELTDAQLADERGGPVEANPARGQQSVSHKEAFEDRIDGNRHRFLKQAADTLAALIKERGWDRLVVAGTPKIREELLGLLTTNDLDLLIADASWEGLSAAQIAERAWPLLRSVHREREQQMVEAVRDRTAAGGAGAVGARRVCAAANMGRVAHLLFAHDTALEGFVAEDGTLHAEVGGAAAQADLVMTREPYLVERLVERVLSMGGRVTRVDDEEAARGLAAHDGLGALLRW
jgi:hypothetical protein